MTDSSAAPASNERIAAFYDEHSKRLLRDFVRGNPRVIEAVRLVISRLNGTARTILDVGCGIGTSSYAYARADPNVRVLGVDISPRSLEVATALFGNDRVNFAVSDLSAPPAGGPFDVVALIDVYEHFPRAEWLRFNRVLGECLQPDGILVLTTPSVFHQNYLHEHQPGELQIVDETVDLQDLLRLAHDLGATLTHYSVIPVWKTHQYVHAVFERRPQYDPVKKQRSSRRRTLQQRAWRAIQALRGADDSSAAPGQETATEAGRRALIRRRLGIEIQ